MNLYNKYLMCVFGEKKLQPKGPAEEAVFDIFDLLKSKDLLTRLLEGKTEAEINELMEEMAEGIRISYSETIFRLKSNQGPTTLWEKICAYFD